VGYILTDPFEGAATPCQKQFAEEAVMDFPDVTGAHEKWPPCNFADFADYLTGDCIVNGNVLRAALWDVMFQGKSCAFRESGTPCGF
jgi:hypothetical protein